MFLVLLATACITDKDELYSFGYITAPANVSAVFDITQDNTGLVSILPNAEGAQKLKSTLAMVLLKPKLMPALWPLIIMPKENIL